MRQFIKIRFILFIGFYLGFISPVYSQFITDYKRSNIGRYKIISKDLTGKKWKIEEERKIYQYNEKLKQYNVDKIIVHDYEGVLFEQYTNNGKLQYKFSLNFYNLDHGIEKTLNLSYFVEGRSDNYDVEPIDFDNESYCDGKHIKVILRSRLKPQYRNIETDRYYYDQVFLNLKQDGVIAYYPEPLNFELSEPKARIYDVHPDKYSCKSGVIFFK